MVFSVISCQGNTPSSNQLVTVNVKVDIQTGKTISEIEKYGNLYVVILSDNEKEFNFNSSFPKYRTKNSF